MILVEEIVQKLYKTDSYFIGSCNKYIEHGPKLIEQTFRCVLYLIQTSCHMYLIVLSSYYLLE